MQNRLPFLLIVLLFSMSIVSSCFGQDSEETLPLASEEYTLEGDAMAQADSALWTPAFLSESSSAFTNGLRQGHVYSSIDFAMLSASDEAFQFDGDSVLTPRFQLGWESEVGWGVRGGYWNYKNTVSNLLIDREISTTLVPDFDMNGAPITTSAVPNEGDFETVYESLDLNVYQRFNAGKTLLTVGGGLKSVSGQWQDLYILDTISFHENRLFAGLLNQYSVEGMGPSLFAEFQRPVFERNDIQLVFFTAARTSFVTADYEIRNSTATSLSLDDELWINEGNVGVELSRRYHWLVLRLRGQFETQLWNSSVMDKQALTGTSVSFGIDW